MSSSLAMPRTKVLVGIRPASIQALKGRPLSQEYSVIEPSDFQVAVHNEYFVGYDEFVRIKDRDDVILLDARPPAIYEGLGPWNKPGHIPGAHQFAMDEPNE